MKQLLTVPAALLEGFAIAVLTALIIVLASLALWFTPFEMSGDLGDVVGVSAAVWAFAHLVPLEINLSAVTAIEFGLGEDPLGFAVSLAPLGFTLLTVGFAWYRTSTFRGDVRLAPYRLAGNTVGFFVAASLLSLISSDSLGVGWVGAGFIATLCFFVPALAAFVWASIRDEYPWWEFVAGLADRLSERVRGGEEALEYCREALRLFGYLATGLVGLASLGLGVSIVLNYPSAIALTEALHPGVLGIVLLFLLQLAYLPVALVWALSWLSGAGFSLGDASSLSPFEVVAGPLPPFPLFASLPGEWGVMGLVAPTLIVAVAALVGALAFSPHEHTPWLQKLVSCVVAGLLAGLAALLLAFLATGDLGPGRLTGLGPHAGLFAGLLAAEVIIGLLVGAFGQTLGRRYLPEKESF